VGLIALLSGAGPEARSAALEPAVRIHPDLWPESPPAFAPDAVLEAGNNKFSPPSEWLALVDRFYDASLDPSHGLHPIPTMWGTDAVQGHNNLVGATIFPHNIALGAAHDPEPIREIGEVTAREVRATGMEWTFGPTAKHFVGDGGTTAAAATDTRVFFARGKPGSGWRWDLTKVFTDARPSQWHHVKVPAGDGHGRAAQLHAEQNLTQHERPT
jgi:Glycosyl hydrolase family 3 N terminal domain